MWSALAARAGVSRLGELGVTEADVPRIMEASPSAATSRPTPRARRRDDEIRAVIERAL